MLTDILAFPFQYRNYFSLSWFINYYFANLHPTGLKRKDSEHQKMLCHCLALNSRVMGGRGTEGEQNTGTCAPLSHCLSKFYQVKYNLVVFLECWLLYRKVCFKSSLCKHCFCLTEHSKYTAAPILIFCLSFSDRTVHCYCPGSICHFVGVLDAAVCSSVLSLGSAH